MPPDPSPRRYPTAWDFNQEIIFGEMGALLGAYAAGLTSARLSHSSTLISAMLIPGTLAGGTIFWLTARIKHQRRRRNWSLAGLAQDIGYFTPAATLLGFVVYDPLIFLTSRFLLVHRSGIVLSVAGGELVAFSFFLLSMNAYRLLLAKTGRRHL
jgi:hypothetical protein